MFYQTSAWKYCPKSVLNSLFYSPRFWKKIKWSGRCALDCAGGASPSVHAEAKMDLWTKKLLRITSCSSQSVLEFFFCSMDNENKKLLECMYYMYVMLISMQLVAYHGSKIRLGIQTSLVGQQPLLPIAPEEIRLGPSQFFNRLYPDCCRFCGYFLIVTNNNLSKHHMKIFSNLLCWGFSEFPHPKAGNKDQLLFWVK